MSVEAGQRKQESRFSWAVVLSVLLVVVAVAMAAYVRILPLGAGACVPHCDSERLSIAVNGFLVAAVAVPVLTLLGVILLRKAGRWPLALAALGWLLLITAFWISTEVAGLIMQPVTGAALRA